MNPPGTLFFVCKVNVQCMDGILEGGEAHMEGFFSHYITDLLTCHFNSHSYFDKNLEWECLAGKSVVAVCIVTEILAGQVMCCLTALPPPFWEDSLTDLGRLCPALLMFCSSSVCSQTVRRLTPLLVS